MLHNILWCVCGDKQRNYKNTSPQVEFAYNMVNQSCFPSHVCDLAIMPIAGEGTKAADNVADKALQIHVEVGAFLKAANAKYKVEPDKHRCKKLF